MHVHVHVLHVYCHLPKGLRFTILLTLLPIKSVTLQVYLLPPARVTGKTVKRGLSTPINSQLMPQLGVSQSYVKPKPEAVQLNVALRPMVTLRLLRLRITGRGTVRREGGREEREGGRREREGGREGERKGEGGREGEN